MLSMDGIRRKPPAACLAVAGFLLFCPMLHDFIGEPVVSATPHAPTAGRIQEPAFRSVSSELVVLPVVVTDRQSRYVADLGRDRFVVYDNGRRVPVELFSNEDTPVTIGLIVDASGSMRPKLGEVLAASLAFATSSNPQDELFALRFNDDVREAVPD